MRVFAKGVNFMGQLGIQNGYKNCHQYEEITQLRDRKIVQLDTHFTQSFCLLDDSQILHWGYVFDSLTTTRVLNWYKKQPKLCQLWQKYSILGKTLSLRLGQENLSLINPQLLQNNQLVKISVGGGFVIALSKEGKIYGFGENYKGQLGLGDSKYRTNFQEIQLDTQEKVVDISTGFQHTMAITDISSIYGFGRSNWNQIVVPAKEKYGKIYSDFHTSPVRMKLQNQHIKQISCGFQHNLILTVSNKLFAIGNNRNGQCGASNLMIQNVDKFVEVMTDLEPKENIIQIQAGKSHNVFLTNLGNLYFFGSTFHNQLTHPQEFGLDVCSPIKIKTKGFLKENEKIIKIKSKFDRTAVFTNFGNAYVWGGEDLSKIGAENYSMIQNIQEQIGLGYQIYDIGLGYLHTIVACRQI